MKTRSKKNKKRIKRVDSLAAFLDEDDEILERSFHYKAINKLKPFLNANCQIILMPRVNIKAIFYNISGNVAFEDVFLFIKSRDDSYECPICLEKTTIPMITKCGHIFCLVCIVRSLTFNTINNQKCPICTSILNFNDIRMLLWRNLHKIHKDMDTELYLCKRYKNHSFINIARNETYSFPCFDSNIKYNDNGNWEIDDDGSECTLNRIMVYPPNSKTILSIINSSLDIIRNIVNESSEADDDLWKITAIEILLKYLKVAEKYSSDNLSSFPVLGNSHYLFYQCPKNENTYLHPHNLQQIISLSEISNNSNKLPYIINGQIVSICQRKITPQFLKSFPCFQHIPLSSEITLIFLKLNDFENIDTELSYTHIEKFENIEESTDDISQYYYNNSISNLNSESVNENIEQSFMVTSIIGDENDFPDLVHS